MSKRTLASALALVTLAVCGAAQEMTVGELRTIGEGRPVPPHLRNYDTVSIRKQTSVVPVMAWSLAAFALILVGWFVVRTVNPNFIAGREQAKRQLQEQKTRDRAGRTGALPAHEILQPTPAEVDSVKIHYPGFSWKSYGTAGGDVLIVTCPIDNPPPYKLVNMTLAVRCFDFADNLVVDKTQKKLTDLGMDFAPPGQVRDHELMVELGSTPSSAVTKVEVKIEDFQCTKMTDLDTQLTDLQNRLRKFQTGGHDWPHPRTGRDLQGIPPVGGGWGPKSLRSSSTEPSSGWTRRCGESGRWIRRFPSHPRWRNSSCRTPKRSSPG